MNEAELIEYLRKNKIPKDEGTYPRELLAQITIKAFEELGKNTQKLCNNLEIVEDELRGARNRLSEIEEIAKGE